MASSRRITRIEEVLVYPDANDPGRAYPLVSAQLFLNRVWNLTEDHDRRLGDLSFFGSETRYFDGDQVFEGPPIDAERWTIAKVNYGLLTQYWQRVLSLPCWASITMHPPATILRRTAMNSLLRDNAFATETAELDHDPDAGIELLQRCREEAVHILAPVIAIFVASAEEVYWQSYWNPPIRSHTSVETRLEAPAETPLPNEQYASPTRRVVLFGPEDKPIVDGESVSRLTDRTYQVVAAILANRGVMKLAQLKRVNSDCRAILKRLREQPVWTKVIGMPKPKSPGYKIL